MVAGETNEAVENRRIRSPISWKIDRFLVDVDGSDDDVEDDNGFELNLFTFFLYSEEDDDEDEGEAVAELVTKCVEQF